MSTPPRRETAKIYRFPSRLRIAATDMPPTDRAATARLFSVCDTGNGWYHEAAILDDQRGRKP